MTPTDTARLLAVLSAAFPHVAVTRETAEVYHETLGDLDADAARAAVRELLLVSDRWPAPATIRRRVAERAGLLAPPPGAAWGEVLAAARTIGWVSRPAFSHPAIERTVDALGWRNICLSEMPDTIRAHFLRAYEPEARAADDRTVSDALAGLPSAVTRAAIGAGS